MSSRNSGRCEAARFALRSHQWAKAEFQDDVEESVIDLLTDLRYYCDACGLNWATLDRLAAWHHDAE